MQYQVQDKEAANLLDCKTNRKIINCTRLLGDELTNNKLDEDGVDDSIVLIDTRGLALKFDVMPGPRELKRYAQAFVQYACEIAVALEMGKDAVVFCKNGRSRSPSVVATFFLIFRGMSLDEIKKWFGEAYPAQRPTTAKVSTVFPNLEKFDNVLQFLINCLVEPTKTIQGFNLYSKWTSLYQAYSCILISN